MNKVGNAELLRSARDMAKNTTGHQRINALFDVGSFSEIDCFARSGEGYTEAVAGFGTIEGCPAYAFAQNSDIDGGAMSSAQAAKIKKIYNLAVTTGLPVIGIYDSIGGRLQEGADMLAAYGEILLGANNLSGVVPQISLILGPCIGTSAMIAASADIIVMSNKGELTIDTNGEHGSAGEAVELGLCHIAAGDEQEAIASVRKLITLIPSNNLSGVPVLDIQGSSNSAILQNNSDVKSIIAAVCDENSFIEFSERFGKSAVTGLSEIDGSTTGIIALNGVLDADSCSKAARFIRFCDAYSLPVVTFVDAERFASLREASKLSSCYSEATTGKITVITGSAYGSVYIATAGRGANADYTFSWPDAVVSPLAPETAAVFLWSDRLAGSANPVEERKNLIEEYKVTQASPFTAAANGFVEDIIDPKDTRIRIIEVLQMISGKRVSRLPKKHSNIQI
ncbi:acyl-CoA carboxylase subunit beta [Caproiciproducens sp.]|uniref:acyl-CoA carboxylase subunit beta n=1 Tax=Caproiciproducens sp. TaxID=1954376 RepID=UPI00289E632A|nr:carboxyl transferase domain-containing protein [Caproiciproducens sp.]